jgi:plasmid stability protein
MGQILVRNLDDSVIDALRRLAVASDTSTEEQARRALTRAVGLGRAEALKRLDAVRESIGRLEDFSTLEQLRRDRDRDGM